MKYLTRIAVFIGLIMILAVVASAQAAEIKSENDSLTKLENTQTNNTKSTGKQISIDKKDKSIARYHLNDIWIHQTWIQYLVDEDGDGFYHHFRFRFDADTSYDTQSLYAEVFLSDGSEEWLIFESGTFFIHGQSGNDVYEMSTSLNTGYPTQTYALTLRLYDAVSHELLLELNELDDSELAYLYLEDADRDSEYSSTPYVHSYTTELNDDFDGDGYFSQIVLTIDVDAPFSSQDIRIGVELYDAYEGWQSLYLSEEITIAGSYSSDKETITIDLDNGYRENNYELKMTVYESQSRAIIASESISQSLPLESLDHENDDEYRSSKSHGHGGAFTLLALIPLLAMAVLRFRYSRKH